MGWIAYVVVLGCVACALLGSMRYFRRYQLPRPPIGVLNHTDILVMIIAIVALPFLYLILPLWVVASFFMLSALSVLYFAFQPVLQRRWLVWLVALLLVVVDGVAVSLFGSGENAYFLVNNLVLLALVVGIANLWAQSGVTARDMVFLGVALALYDFVATAQSPLMVSLVGRLSSLPFAPVIAWNSAGVTLILGLGDLLIASAFPLVMRKAFGQRAGGIALALTLLTITLTLTILVAYPQRQGFPVMTVLGPLMVAQFLYWRWRTGHERTTKQYVLDEPL